MVPRNFDQDFTDELFASNNTIQQLPVRYINTMQQLPNNYFTPIVRPARVDEDVVDELLRLMRYRDEQNTIDTQRLANLDRIMADLVHRFPHDYFTPIVHYEGEEYESEEDDNPLTAKEVVMKYVHTHLDRSIGNLSMSHVASIVAEAGKEKDEAMITQAVYELCELAGSSVSCAICLEEEGSFISPCTRCYGTFLHRHCMEKLHNDQCVTCRRKRSGK